MDATQDEMIAEYRREYDRFIEAFAQANEALATIPDEERIGDAKTFTAAYDADEDSFILWLGEPVAAATQALADPSMHLRFDPVTYRIVGFEVLDVTQWIAAHADDPAYLSHRVQQFIDAFGPGTHSRPIDTDDGGSLTQSMRALVTA